MSDIIKVKNDSAEKISIKTAASGSLSVIKVGNSPTGTTVIRLGSDVKNQSVISIANMPVAFVRLSGAPLATIERVGCIKVGESLSVLKDGTLSVDITNNTPLKIELDSKVPKALDILSHVDSISISTPAQRKAGLLYINLNGEAGNVTLEQIKELNSKLLYVDSLSDSQIESLSKGDYILLNKE